MSFVIYPANQITSIPVPTAQGGTSSTSLTTITVGKSSNLDAGSNGTIPYQSAPGVTQMLSVGTPGQLLQTNGIGAPTWVTVSTGATTQAFIAFGSTGGL